MKIRERTKFAVIAVAMAGVFLSRLGAATLVYIDGDVSVLRDGQEFFADFGTELFESDTVKTGPESTAIIDLDGRGELKLQPSTDLHMNSLGEQTEVELTQGAVFSRLSRLNGDTYSLRAGSALAGVRGTEFYTAYGRMVDSEPDVWLCVNEGLVAVELENGKQVDVAEGEGINILSGQDMTDPQFFAWTENLNWNMDPSQGEIIDSTEIDSMYDDLLDVDYD